MKACVVPSNWFRTINLKFNVKLSVCDNSKWDSSIFHDNWKQPFERISNSIVDLLNYHISNAYLFVIRTSYGGSFQIGVLKKNWTSIQFMCIFIKHLKFWGIAVHLSPKHNISLNAENIYEFALVLVLQNIFEFALLLWFETFSVYKCTLQIPKCVSW